MTDATVEVQEPVGKKGRMTVILAAILGIAGAGIGYYAAVTGALPYVGGGASKHDVGRAPSGDSGVAALPQVTFVDLSPIIVSLGDTGELLHLRFHAQLEVEDAHAQEVERMKPRIVDVINGYLRALEVTDLRDPLALSRLRGHILRRINIVLGEGRVRDILVMEFVLN
ncbi:flagellar basal body-associated protein FliL [Lutimaribacter marinistellae]|uniref:Flagellar protein FliL n=1 Tax=Lutimaribacter marinistellae TaxID=1820329 RepID=A0ABV7TBK7_9RHOB